jgi:hypothetical protein
MDMPTESEDPGDIRSIAVTAQDVVTATETNRTTDRTAVLRVTPPFSGRMRARLHVRQSDDSTEDGVIQVSPDTLVGPDAPDYPRPAATEDELRGDPDTEYTVERHREYHEAAVEEWRRAIRDAISESVTLVSDETTHDVTVHVLG